MHCTRLAALTGQDYTASGKPRIAWDDPAARDELVTALVNDALALLAALDVEAIEKAGGKPAEAVALLALVAGQDVEPVEDSDGTDGRWRIARKTAPDRMISTVDPDARHAHKTRERRQDGFKAHVVVEPDTGLTTAVRLTKTNGPENSDATVGAELVTADPTIAAGASAVEVLGDSAYATGDMLHALDEQEAGPRCSSRGRSSPPSRAGSPSTTSPTTADAGTLTCPAGVTRTSPKGNAVFGIACRDCPLRSRMHHRQQRPHDRRLHQHDLLQRAHRERAADEGFQATYRTHRPMVERSIAWLTRGNRRVPYRGIEKNNDWLHHRVAALNLRRLLALGLTIENGTWHWPEQARQGLNQPTGPHHHGP